MVLRSCYANYGAVLRRSIHRTWHLCRTWIHGNANALAAKAYLPPGRRCAGKEAWRMGSTSARKARDRLGYTLQHLPCSSARKAMDRLGYRLQHFPYSAQSLAVRCRSCQLIPRFNLDSEGMFVVYNSSCVHTYTCTRSCSASTVGFVHFVAALYTGRIGCTSKVFRSLHGPCGYLRSSPYLTCHATVRSSP